MSLSFNTAGPCYHDEHYMLPPERRLGEVLELIEARKYFTFTAGWQTGKTTCALWIEEYLNAKGDWRALWVDIETAREQPEPGKAFRTILGKLDDVCADIHPDVTRPDIDTLLQDPAPALSKYLEHIARQSDRPWAIFFDEADGLVGETMVSFLTQLRDGYLSRRRRPFPASVVLVGRRQVRDYALREEDRRSISWLGTSSPFNITAEAMSLEPFTEAEVGELLGQHTAQTGQVFLPDATAKIYELGQGHPWLTNAMADQIVRKDVRDHSVAITAAHVDAAKDTIILQRRTHIDALVAKLREERVRRIIDPMIAGERASGEMIHDDFAYVRGLGLIRDHDGQYEVANPIYREIILRALTYDEQHQVKNLPRSYVRQNGSLDMPKLMTDWQVFWREGGHLAAEGFGYRESGPHLMLMAFLQRIVNGGGRIEREYGLGRRALDLLVFWKDERYAIEVKVRRDTETENRGVKQLADYLDRLGLTEGWLVLFDRRKRVSWQEKLVQRDVEYAGKRIRVVGSCGARESVWRGKRSRERVISFQRSGYRFRVAQ